MTSRQDLCDLGSGKSIEFFCTENSKEGGVGHLCAWRTGQKRGRTGEDLTLMGENVCKWEGLAGPRGTEHCKYLGISLPTPVHGQAEMT